MTESEPPRARPVRNFGRNLSFKVGRYVSPRSEQEVKEILANCGLGSVRATGARHSWSEAFATHDTLLDPSHLREMRIEEGDGDTRVAVGAGCKVNDLLEFLREKELSLPTFGIIGEQSIAGAVSTATHGSGHSSMSNEVLEARLAAYDRDGSTRIVKLPEPAADLEAARCAVGCMGVLLGLKLRCVGRQLVSERAWKADSLEAMLANEESHPLQQFYLLPFVWKWHAQLRRRTDAARSSWFARKWFYLKRFLKIELFFNGAVKLLANIPGLGRFFLSFYRLMYALTDEGEDEIVDYADRLLMMRDDLFRHVEMELFVSPDRLPEAVDFVEGVLRFCAGEVPENFGAISQIVACHGDTKALAGLKGSYVHHYPITFRKVLKDNTMISMTSGGDAYAVSFISYRRNTDSFEAVMGFLASIMARAFDARPHWGKLLPLDASEIERLYPRLLEFRACCEAYDPKGALRNRFVGRKMWPQPTR